MPSQATSEGDETAPAPSVSEPVTSAGDVESPSKAEDSTQETGPTLGQPGRYGVFGYVEVQTRLAEGVYGVRASFKAREADFVYGLTPGCAFVPMPTEVPVDDDGVPYPERFDAGLIEFLGVSDEPAERYVAELSPDESLDYGWADYEPYGIPGTARLSVQATGGADIPRFQIGLDSPLSLLLTQPAVSQSAGGEARLAIPREQPLTLTWDRGAAGVWLEAFVLGEDAMLRCGFPSELGAGEIAVDLLGQFEAGATVEFFTSAYADVLAGEVRVWFGARRELLVPDRSAFIKGVLE